ncbi:MAG: hypothetical protein ACYC6Y_18880, partial [Thermoguttaceae bacterium]
ENRSETFPDNAPGQAARFWVEGLEGRSIRRYLPTEKAAEESAEAAAVRVVLDQQGWPVSASWPGMDQPLFEAGTGDFLSVGLSGFGGRWTYSDIHGLSNPAKRSQRRQESLKEEAAVAAGPATCQQNAHTTLYTQPLAHSRLKWLTRRMEVWNREPRARLTVRFHRGESELPEIFFISSVLPSGGKLPQMSNGGLPFVPFDDQLPGTCREYFAIDGWARYQAAAGRWLWVTRDAPLVAVGGHQVLARPESAPQEPGRLFAMVFNNVWFTNFVADSHGAMEFQFDFAWQPPGEKLVEPAELAASLVSEPQLVINPAARENPIFMERLHRPAGPPASTGFGSN